jgi:polyhydroxyalkanoate synthesis regulator phasin
VARRTEGETAAAKRGAAPVPPGEEASSRAEASLRAFREALDQSVTISRQRLEEVLDDAVQRGRMTRGDAEELVGRLISRGREQAETFASELETVVSELRSEVGARAERGRRRTVAAVDAPLAGADRVRRKTGLGFPISAYDQLTIRQIDRRLVELSAEELRRVRDYEQRNRARKGVLGSIDRKLEA